MFLQRSTSSYCQSCRPLKQFPLTPARSKPRCVDSVAVQTRTSLQGAHSQLTFDSKWDYKYPHFSCASLCSPEDTRYLKVEALFQNVLSHPRLPSRVHRFLSAVSADIDTITKTVESLANFYGQELVLYFLRQQPQLLDSDSEAVISRAEFVGAMLGLRPSEVLTVLRKNPNLLVMDSSVVRGRFAALHEVMHWTRDNVRTLVLKFPLILNYQTARVQHLMCVLQQVSSKRAQWRQDFAAMTPSLVAFYIKDAKDMLLRLEFLIETGEGQNMNFRTIFKASNNLFTKKYANFRSWQRMRKQQDQQQQQQPRLQQRMHG